MSYALKVIETGVNAAPVLEVNEKVSVSLARFAGAAADDVPWLRVSTEFVLVGSTT